MFIILMGEFQLNKFFSNHQATKIVLKVIYFILQVVINS